jgi:hypothetical protein
LDILGSLNVNLMDVGRKFVVKGASNKIASIIFRVTPNCSNATSTSKDDVSKGLFVTVWISSKFKKYVRDS